MIKVIMSMATFVENLEVNIEFSLCKRREPGTIRVLAAARKL
jgi:hypothetical protein